MRQCHLNNTHFYYYGTTTIFSPSSVLHRSITSLHHSIHSADTLTSFHWLCALKQIKFQLVVIVLFITLHLDTCLTHCIVLLICPLCHWEVISGCRPPVVFTFVCDLLSSVLETSHLVLPAPRSRTVFLMMSHLPHLCQCSIKNSRLVCFGSHARMLFFTIVVLEGEYPVKRFKKNLAWGGTPRPAPSWQI